MGLMEGHGKNLFTTTGEPDLQLVPIGIVGNPFELHLGPLLCEQARLPPVLARSSLYCFLWIFS